MITRPNIKNLITRRSLYITLAATFCIVALALVAYPFSAYARHGSGFHKSSEQIVERLKGRLGLTAEQVEAIRPIIKDKAQKMHEIRQKSGADKHAARIKMQKLRLDTETKLNKILTDEQIGKYLQLREEKRGKFYRGKFHSGRMGKGFDRTPEQVMSRLTDRLDLTEKQAAEIEPIIKESLEKKREVFDKYDEKRQEVRKAMRDELQGIGEETHQQLSNILTHEQIEDFLTLKQEKRARMDKWKRHHGYKSW